LEILLQHSMRRATHRIGGLRGELVGWSYTYVVVAKSHLLWPRELGPAQVVQRAIALEMKRERQCSPNQ
jgi:hypothetical protein